VNFYLKVFLLAGLIIGVGAGVFALSQGGVWGAIPILITTVCYIFLTRGSVLRTYKSHAYKQSDIDVQHYLWTEIVSRSVFSCFVAGPVIAVLGFVYGGEGRYIYAVAGIAVSLAAFALSRPLHYFVDRFYGKKCR
jgi:hypothetical protein